jgi:hypothetical protein
MIYFTPIAPGKVRSFATGCSAGPSAEPGMKFMQASAARLPAPGWCGLAVGFAACCVPLLVLHSSLNNN